MYDLSARTGKYLHAPDDLLRLGYETGGTPRLFTVLIAQAVETDRIDPEGAGIVVLDEDEGRVLLDRHVPTGDGLGEELYRIRGMSWSEFSGFCRTHPRFRGGPPDLVTPQEVPLPGSRQRQRGLNLGSAVGAEAAEDLRSALMTVADRDPSCPVRFPARDRDGVIRDLSARVLTVEDPAPFRLGWVLRRPTSPDLSGLGGERPVDRSLDLFWEELIERRPELLEEAWAGALETLVGGRIATFGAQDEGRYDLRLLGAEEGPVLCLHAFDGRPLGGRTRDALMAELTGISRTELRDLWKLNRTLEVETGRDRLEARFREELNRVRSETEASRDLEPAPSGP